MNTEHTKHPCETVEASADVMKLAEMILSDCGQSTVISDRLQRRVAGRIQQHMDSAAQKLQGQVDTLLAAMNVIALGELPDGKYVNISTMAYAEEAYKAAQRAPIKDSLTTDRQAEPVALAVLVRVAADTALWIRKNDRIPNDKEMADIVWPFAAQPPAVAVPDSTYERKRFAKWFCMQDALKENDASMDGYWAGWLARSMQPPAVPDGYALAPIKPTDLMLDAAVNAGDEPGSDYYTIYAAMLAAAQKGGAA